MAEVEWPEDEVLQFIKHYEEMPVLWYPKHPGHYNPMNRNVAWEEMALKTGKSAEKCKNKMTSLLASMRRVKAKMRNHLKKDKVYKSSWFAFESMQFLWDRAKMQDPTSTIPEIEICDSLEPDLDTYHDEGKDFDTGIIHASTPTHTKIPSKKRPRKQVVLWQDAASKTPRLSASSNDEAQDECLDTASEIPKSSISLMNVAQDQQLDTPCEIPKSSISSMNVAQDRPLDTPSEIPKSSISLMNVEQDRHLDTASRKPKSSISSKNVAQDRRLDTTSAIPKSSISSMNVPQDRRLDTALEILRTYVTSNDEEQDFGNLVAKKLRKYDSYTRSAVQHEILGIFVKADKEHFSATSTIDLFETKK